MQGLRYINSDVTVYLHRQPVTEWIGYEVTDHGATDGVAIAECRLYDEHGHIGTSSVTALAQRTTTAARCRRRRRRQCRSKPSASD